MPYKNVGKEKEEIRENFEVHARTLKIASTDNDGMDSLLLKLLRFLHQEKIEAKTGKTANKLLLGKRTKFSSPPFLRMSKIYIMYPYANASFAIFTEKERIAMTM